MLIESSRLYGSGFRTPFKFHASFKSSSGTVTLYPGMVLAARGRNGGGGCFVATEILDVSDKHHCLIVA
jgi:DNA polymerase alpha subunit B